MYNKLQELRARREDGEGGFTLIELLVVVVIIGILVAIAIPLYLHFENGAKTSSAKSDVHNLVAVVQQCASDNSGTVPTAATATGGVVTFAWGSTNCNETGVLSPNNTLVYASPDASGGPAGSYLITVYNTQSKNGAQYDSANGQTVPYAYTGS